MCRRDHRVIHLLMVVALVALLTASGINLYRSLNTRSASTSIALGVGERFAADPGEQSAGGEAEMLRGIIGYWNNRVTYPLAASTGPGSSQRCAEMRNSCPPSLPGR